MLCPYCGVELTKKWIVCDNCGKTIPKKLVDQQIYNSAPEKSNQLHHKTFTAKIKTFCHLL